jgi:hypothetical protein
MIKVVGVRITKYGDYEMFFKTRGVMKCLVLFWMTLILTFQYEHGAAQSLTGTTGLVTIPTGEKLNDGEISFGVNLLNKKHLDYFSGRQHSNAYFVTIGYLPFLEIGLRFTRAWHPGPSSVGDRMASVRLKLMQERAEVPSLVLGAHDFLSNVGSHFNALYLVASKTVPFKFPVGKTALHLGYGVDWLDARNHEFAGLFGGISWSPNKIIVLMLEHDAVRFNSGVRLFLFNHLGLLVAFQNFDSLSAGLSYRFTLSGNGKRIGGAKD